MAIRNRRGQKLEGLILHSDGGGQYYDKEFLALTQKYCMYNSMAEYACRKWHGRKVKWRDQEQLPFNTENVNPSQN
ncbi:MAG: hypothetical protein IPG85_04380 [Bacteroidetes bacterium]|nr:hypothetical protein [Bacteroidota bacterium]